jgi:hypothetical protein
MSHPDDTEALRLSFMPDRIRLLLVGESAPSSGKFFYRANSNAYHHIRTAFGRAGDPGFLYWFKSQGYYLDDLVLTPINKAANKDRRLAAQDGVRPLGNRIRSYAPRMVIAFSRQIGAEVAAALALSGVSAEYHCVRFPGSGQQGNFQHDMAPLMNRIAAL